MVSGLVATFVDTPLELREMISLPKSHLEACTAGGIPVSGNAAGNARNFLDLTGQHEPPPPSS